MEKCSVCGCSEEEIPKNWLAERLFSDAQSSSDEIDDDDDDMFSAYDAYISDVKRSSKSNTSPRTLMGWISPEYGSVNDNHALETIARNSSHYITHREMKGNSNGKSNNGKGNGKHPPSAVKDGE